MFTSTERLKKPRHIGPTVGRKNAFELKRRLLDYSSIAISDTQLETAAVNGFDTGFLMQSGFMVRAVSESIRDFPESHDLGVSK